MFFILLLCCCKGGDVSSNGSSQLQATKVPAAQQRSHSLCSSNATSASAYAGLMPSMELPEVAQPSCSGRQRSQQHLGGQEHESEPEVQVLHCLFSVLFEASLLHIDNELLALVFPLSVAMPSFQVWCCLRASVWRFCCKLFLWQDSEYSFSNVIDLECLLFWWRIASDDWLAAQLLVATVMLGFAHEMWPWCVSEVPPVMPCLWPSGSNSKAAYDAPHSCCSCVPVL